MRSGLILFNVIFLFASCIDPYPIPEIPSTAGYLVVDGFMNSNGPTTIKISHTLAVYDRYNIPLPELKAKVDVESEDKTIVYSLTDRGKGIYSVDFLPLDYSKQYRIHIKTTSNKEYISEYVPVMKSPPIEKITWEMDDEKSGIYIYVYAKDENNATHYYNWDYDETWGYHSNFATSWEWINGRAVLNYRRENIYYCWMLKKPTNIIIKSTDKLSQSVVHKFPVAFIPFSSRKLMMGYRFLLKQYAVTAEAYQYLVELKKNSEQQGTLFDAQPSQLTGNLYCVTNPDEPVFGYINAHSGPEKEIFIYPYEVPPYNIIDSSLACPGPRNSPAELTRLITAGLYIPADDTAKITSGPPAPIYLPKVCVDCREQGGTNKKPTNWPL
jgi:hypothetical protein